MKKLGSYIGTFIAGFVGGVIVNEIVDKKLKEKENLTLDKKVEPKKKSSDLMSTLPLISAAIEAATSKLGKDADNLVKDLKKVEKDSKKEDLNQLFDFFNKNKTEKKEDEKTFY